MATISKAMLAADNAALRKQVGDLQQHVVILKAEVAVFARSAHDAIARNDGLDAVTGQRTHYVSRRQLPAHMQAAKDMAMRAGITVKVGA